MLHLRLRAALCCLVVGSVVLSGASAASAATKGVTLTATASFPGVAAPQRYRLQLGADWLEGLRVVSRPDAASVVVVDRPMRTVRRHGKRVRVATKPCARGTLSIALQPGAGDPLVAGRLLLPQAQTERYVDFGAPRHDPDHDVATLGFSDVGPKVDSSRIDHAIDLAVFRWKSAGLEGLSSATMRSERLRRTGPCAMPTRAFLPDDPLDAVRFIWEGVGL